MQSKNPLIEPYNYWSPYQASIEKLKESSGDSLEFEKLCHEVFETAAGMKLMRLIEQQYLIPSLAHRGAPNYDLACVWANGFKEAFLVLRHALVTHRERIKSLV